MATRISETETVIKRIIPYLVRRGYDIDKDLHFEVLAKNKERYDAGYIDILVWLDDKTYPKGSPTFLIEAKRLGKQLSDKDKTQAISYAKAEGLNVPFVVVCNGSDIRCFNVKNGRAIKWNGKLSAKIPAKSQIRKVFAVFKKNAEVDDIPLDGEENVPSGVSSLPYRPGLPLRQLNALFSRCHNAIRKNEKDENHIFDDFSKILFLKLLEEKADMDPSFNLPYTYLFYELAAYSDAKSDQVESAVKDMIQKIKDKTSYGEVLADPLNLKTSKTFAYLIKQFAAVSFYDSAMDSKGAAFEYFVRATLKGKKLGQYFTPRPLVQLMATLVGKEKIINSLLSGKKNPPKVLDPACGTGGFLVFLMRDCLNIIDNKLESRAIDKSTHQSLAEKIQKAVFFGSDANDGVACAAKMNMIVAGDGHSNIKAENSLAKNAKNWNIDTPDCDFILTNPPFGTSESGALEKNDLNQFEIKTPKGQWLFLQKMVLCAKRGAEICTVIDEGVLNTDSATEIRQWIISKCIVLAVVSLPHETFMPNKINVKSSLLYLRRKTLDEETLGLDISYKITFCNLLSLGIDGAGDKIRQFDFEKLLADVEEKWLKQGTARKGMGWEAFDIDATYISDEVVNPTARLDVKFWQPDIRKEIAKLAKNGGITIKELNLIETARGISPDAGVYVDRQDGYALVIKAGSNISKFGELIVDGDFIEKSIYDEFVEKASEQGKNLNLVKDKDILVSSTGDGTLGKCCVYHPLRDANGQTIPTAAIAEGHVSIIRVDPKIIYPEYLCDYLRVGFGAQQIERLYTGSTGMIELSPAALNSVVVNLLSGVPAQKNASKALRSGERKSRKTADIAADVNKKALIKFNEETLCSGKIK